MDFSRFTKSDDGFQETRENAYHPLSRSDFEYQMQTLCNIPRDMAHLKLSLMGRLGNELIDVLKWFTQSENHAGFIIRYRGKDYLKYGYAILRGVKLLKPSLRCVALTTSDILSAKQVSQGRDALDFDTELPDGFLLNSLTANVIFLTNFNSSKYGVFHDNKQLNQVKAYLENRIASGSLIIVTHESPIHDTRHYSEWGSLFELISSSERVK